MVDTKSLHTQALVVAPTKDIANHIAFFIQKIGENEKVKVHTCVGGTDVFEDKRILKQGVHVVVGTPGRVHDMMKKGFLKRDHLKIFVLDEADQLLSRSFKQQMQDIFKLLPK